MIWNEEAQLWIPDDTEKTDKCWRFIKRNAPDLDAGIAWTKKRGTAVQAGGHIGIFPNYLANHFERVITFEPDPTLFQCLLKNRFDNVIPFPYALSDFRGKASFRSSVAGTGALDESGDTTIELYVMDDLHERVNFIHLDIEGGEVAALQGAWEIIERDHPTIQLEILPRHKDAIYAYMEKIDYRVANDTRRDHVFVRNDA